jgi:hypothetical protein
MTKKSRSSKSRSAPKGKTVGRPASRPSNIKVLMQVNDAHFPFQHKPSVQASLDALEIVKPDTLMTGSDLIDFYALSKYDKNPKRQNSLQDDLDSAQDFLEQQRKLVGPQCKIHYLEGNHEARLKKYLKRNAKALANLRALRLGELLDTGSLDVHLHTYGKLIKVGDVYYTHGTTHSAGGGNTARSHIKRIGGSVSVGHCHRLSVVHERKDTGFFTGFEGGCLCRFDQEYVLEDWAISRMDWQHAFQIHVFRNNKLISWFQAALDYNPQALKCVSAFMGGFQ